MYTLRVLSLTRKCLKHCFLKNIFCAVLGPVRTEIYVFRTHQFSTSEGASH